MKALLTITFSSNVKEKYQENIMCIDKYKTCNNHTFSNHILYLKHLLYFFSLIKKKWNFLWGNVPKIVISFHWNVQQKFNRYLCVQLYFTLRITKIYVPLQKKKYFGSESTELNSSLLLPKVALYSYLHSITQNIRNKRNHTLLLANTEVE